LKPESTLTQNIFEEKPSSGVKIRFIMDDWYSTLREHWECHQIRIQHEIPEKPLCQVTYTHKETISGEIL
jgi:hypothetical protein